MDRDDYLREERRHEYLRDERRREDQRRAYIREERTTRRLLTHGYSGAGKLGPDPKRDGQRRAQIMDYSNNWRRMTILQAVPALTLILFGSMAGAEPLADHLKLIADTADRICNVITTSGSSRSVDLQGQVKAELGGLASRLADVGISGTGKLNDEQYQSVLRQDLANTLKDNASCKYKVCKDLSDKILQPLTTVPPKEPPLNIGGRWRDNWGINYNVEQQGEVFRYSASGPSCQRGIYFQSSGHGTIQGHKVESSYNSNLPSGGECSGTVFGNGTEMSSTCKDTVCGTFSASLTKQ